MAWVRMCKQHIQPPQQVACTYSQEGVFVTAELQVSIALLVVLHMQRFCGGTGDQAFMAMKPV